MGDFYRMSSDCNRKTPYAPTILNYGEFLKRDCDHCYVTKINTDVEILLLLQGKGKLPDLLVCGHYPLKIFSKRAVDIFKGNGITGFEAYPVKLVNKAGEEVGQDTQYQNIIITGRAELDYEKMGLKVEKICPGCGGTVVDRSVRLWEYGDAVMKEGSHDGSDIFVFKDFETSAACTKKILELVYKKKLTNISFQRYEGKFDFGCDIWPHVDLKEMFGDRRRMK